MEISGTTVALVSVVASAVVAITVPFIGATAQRRAARAAWKLDRAAETYIDTLAHIRRSMALVEATYPVAGPDAVEQPTAEDESALHLLNARVAAFGSPRVKDHVSAWTRKLNEAHIVAAGIFRTEGRSYGPDLDRRTRLEDLRVDLRSRVTYIDALVAHELQGGWGVRKHLPPADRARD